MSIFKQKTRNHCNQIISPDRQKQCRKTLTKIYAFHVSFSKPVKQDVLLVGGAGIPLFSFTTCLDSYKYNYNPGQISRETLPSSPRPQNLIAPVVRNTRSFLTLSGGKGVVPSRASSDSSVLSCGPQIC